ncbi:T9SS type A sorting domain-containing protein [Bacteroidota bacterium]
MKKTLSQFKFFYVSFLIFIGTGIMAFGQSASPALIATSGNYYMNMDSISMSWSIGEVITETLESSSNILTQGLYQTNPGTGSGPQSVDDLFVDGLDINVYPNPFSDQINIFWKNVTELNFIIEIYDLTGNLVLNKELPGKKINEKLDMSTYPASIYVLKIISDEFVKSYNIVKY